MGRAPCCDKANVKKGPWSPEEDAKLKSYIEKHGTGGNWIALPQKMGLKRCGKSCRLRWLNYLRPNIKHGCFSEEEDRIICSLYISIGSRWSVIASQLPGRTDNDIKNYWNTRLKKKLLGNNYNYTHRKEMRKRSTGTTGSENSLVPNHDHNQTLNYWPHQPVLLQAPIIPYPVHDRTRYNDDDQEFVRKLLTEMGGRFSDHHDDDQLLVRERTINSPFHHQVSAPVGSLCEAGDDKVAQNQYNIDGANNLLMLQGESSSCYYVGVVENFSYDHSPGLDGVKLSHTSFVDREKLSERIFPESNKKIDGMEFIYADDMRIKDHGSEYWGEMSSLICSNPLYNSEYEISSMQQGIMSKELNTSN